MNRRNFITGTAALLLSPRRSWAQGTPRRIGYLDTAPLYSPNFKVWQDSLRDHGWIEGKNLIVDYRSAEGHAERVAPLANELVALKPDVLVGPTAQEVLALKSATASIPIVFAAVGDPVRLGLVQSLSHPGGNITGLASVVPGNIVSKRIQILREMSCRLNCGLGQPEQCRSQGLRSLRGVARNCSEAGRDFPGTGGDHGGGTRHCLCLGRGPARRCNCSFGSELTVNHVTRVTALAAEHRCPRSTSSDCSPSMAVWFHTASI